MCCWVGLSESALSSKSCGRAGPAETERTGRTGARAGAVIDRESLPAAHHAACRLPDLLSSCSHCCHPDQGSIPAETMHLSMDPIYPLSHALRTLEVDTTFASRTINSPESYNYKLEEAALARTTAMTREPAAVVPHSTSYNTSLGHSFRAWRGTN